MKKKGFTLIELLAVIVVLAVIALVTIPVIFKMISDSQEKANQQSVQNHIGNINDYIVINMTTSMGSLNGTYTFNELGLSNYPSDDKLRCLSYTVENDNVVAATGCVVNSKSYCYVNSEVTECGMSSNNIDNMVLARVNQIRNTPNTDISGRSGNIYYVSNDGNDTNNGLSESTPFKTITKIHTMFKNNQIPSGSTILLRDGDTFRGFIEVTSPDILIGSYGDISKGKPVLNRSTYDGSKEGNWVEVKPNIWKYTYDGNDQVFKYSVGGIWFFCNNGNNNCTKSMETIDRKFEYAQLITTVSTYSETSIESKIDTLLKNDLEFYHVGHTTNFSTNGKALYLYSTSNPSERFDEIEFSESPNGIYGKTNDLRVDNLKVLFVGRHAIDAGTINNFVITNCEIGFTGGAVQNYNGSGNASVRFGNAIQIYGSVDTTNGKPVTDGFIVNNCYIYQSYDAGPTFQYTTANATRMEKAVFSNNVIEYQNYGIEYWNYTSSTDSSVLEQTYINNFTIENNIIRHSGEGFSQTRPDKGSAAHIKTWNHDRGYNIVKGNFVIKNNTFGEAKERHIYIRASKTSSLPKIINNTFYSNLGDEFGYYFDLDANKLPIKSDKYILDAYLPGNNFIIKNDTQFNDDTGTTGDLNWSYLASTGTLKITGAGAMADYTSDNLPPWNQYKNKIYNIEIGENVTKIGNYSFYDFTNVISIRIDSKNLASLPRSPENVNYGINYAFYHVGNNTLGTKLTFGSEVTKIPMMLLQPTETANDAPFINEVVFEGNKITTIENYGLNGLKVKSLKLPEGVKKTAGFSVGNNKAIKFMIYPDTFTTVGDWSMGNNSNMEKIVLGPITSSISENTFRNMKVLKILVAPHINNPSTAGSLTFNYLNSGNTVTVYGDSSTETWVNNLLAVSTKNNIVYKPLSEYVCTITSDIGINTSVEYNGTYTFTTSANIEIKQYYDASDGQRYYVDADYTKSGNTYTINKIKSDVYINIK